MVLMMHMNWMKIVALMGVMAMLLAFAACTPDTPATTEPSSSLSGEIVVNPPETDPIPSGDVGVGIWGEDEVIDPSGETDPTGEVPTDPTEEPEPSGSVDTGIWDDPTEETTQPTEPEETTQPTTQPTQPTTPPASGTLTWEEYQALNSEQQYAYYLTFDSMADFFEWKNAAEAEYKANNTIPTIDCNIDLGDLMGGNG